METIALTDKLKELVIKRKNIILEKLKFIKEQKYEEAARQRDFERHNKELIIEELPKVKELSKFEENRFWRLIDSIDENDLDFSNAIIKLTRESELRGKISNSLSSPLISNLSIEDLKKVLEKFLYELNALDK